MPCRRISLLYRSGAEVLAGTANKNTQGACSRPGWPATVPGAKSFEGAIRTMRWFLKGMDADLDDSLVFAAWTIPGICAPDRKLPPKSQPGRKNSLQRQNLLSRAGVSRRYLRILGQLAGFKPAPLPQLPVALCQQTSLMKSARIVKNHFAPYRGPVCPCCGDPQSPFYVRGCANGRSWDAHAFHGAL